MWNPGNQISLGGASITAKYVIRVSFKDHDGVSKTQGLDMAIDQYGMAVFVFGDAGFPQVSAFSSDGNWVKPDDPDPPSGRVMWGDTGEVKRLISAYMKANRRDDCRGEFPIPGASGWLFGAVFGVVMSLESVDGTTPNWVLADPVGMEVGIFVGEYDVDASERDGWVAILPVRHAAIAPVGVFARLTTEQSTVSGG